MTTQEKVIDKIRKLNAMAEGAGKIGNRAEAEAFATKVQEMLLTHKLTMSDVENFQQDLDDSFGTEITKDEITKKKRMWWSEQLAKVVAESHFCKIMVHMNNDNITFVGRNSDRKISH